MRPLAASSFAMKNEASPDPRAALRALWLDAGMDEAALADAALSGADPVLPSSFAMGTAAQASLAAAGLAATRLGALRQPGLPPQTVTLELAGALLDCTGHFTLHGQRSSIWDKLSGLYPCDDGAGWVRIHANFEHHRDGALRLLGLPEGPETGREAVIAALREWRAIDFENAGAQAGLVVSALRSFEEWDAHPQAAALRTQPLVSFERIGDADAQRLPDLGADERPLSGLRVLDLTRILAGPVAGRTLAAYGADVMLVNSPKLPNISAIADTSRGKLSTHIDLEDAPGREALATLVASSHVFLQGYRPGALGTRGFGVRDLARMRPGIVVVSLSAYGDRGPWADRRGFDSLVQTATGFNVAEAQASKALEPRPMPVQILDYCAGNLLAFGAQAALWRQAREGGSWHVQVSLARVGHWLRELGRVADGFSVKAPDLQSMLEPPESSGFGVLQGLRHPLRFSRTPARWTRPSMPPGTHAPRWPEPLSSSTA